MWSTMQGTSLRKGVAASRLLGRRVIVQLLQQRLCVVRGVVIHNVQRVERVDLLDVVVELRAHLATDLLDLLQAAGLHEGPASIQVVRQDLGKLLHNVLQDVGGRVQEGLQCRQVGALLDDALQGPLGLGQEVFAGVLVQVDREQPTQHVRLGQGPCVVRRVAANLPQGPRGSSLQVVFGLVDECILEGWDTFRDNDGQGQSL
mmetsp:Transcript_94621/g.305493  ORF Transcript_94621/g.305493 Transcript_94621/m.305493 type:complete len:203 (-) Transcript_94621:35-643(-)